MPKYRALQDISFSVTGVYLEAGAEFESDLPPGLVWEPLDDAAKAATALRRPAPADPALKAKTKT